MPPSPLSPAKSVGIPGFHVAKGGYSWGAVDAPVDIEANVALGYFGVSIEFDPGSGLHGSVDLVPSVGEYTGISVMFDDTLIAD